MPIWLCHTMLTKHISYFATINSGFDWKDNPTTILPIIEYLIASHIKLWIYMQAQFIHVKVLHNLKQEESKRTLI